MIAWPVFVFLLGALFHQKQNSKDPWTGGPISWPKSLWLSNAIYSWFFYPAFLLFLPSSLSDLQLFLWVHLIGWWTRGVLELLMIYRWLSWSPKYGITHDLCQAVFYAVILCWVYFKNPQFNFESTLIFIFGLYLLMEMAFEVSFAVLFLRARTELEAKENIYFASDDPKWLFINKLTRLAVILSFVFGISQAAALLIWN